MKEKKSRRTPLARRLAAGVLTLVLMAGLLPAGVLPAAAAAGEPSWAQEYLDKLVSWGVMRGDIDGNLYPERPVTRAEFVTMVNRAYGYTELEEIPFEDVSPRAWYADDIGIAYHVGYFAGTSETTASPEDYLTREQAALLLGRNMMMKESTGELLGYRDSRDFSEWSRGLMRAVSEAGVISGYPDGTFRPQSYISRAEVACMLSTAIGTPVQRSGEYSLGSVYGNVTVNSPGVTLRNTTIAGDLYLTGGIGLGDVLLQNVTVLGRIVTSGAGESNRGDSSVIMRNVRADEMILDNISQQFVTLRAEGDTSIQKTSVRTPAYIEDVTADGYGLKLIELDGEEGTNLAVAGNVKEVVDYTPNSRLTMAQGVAEKVTVDEKATGSAVTIENGARIKNLNLDIGASVSGQGDIGFLAVNAPGSTVSMLPDTVTVRPGITANVGGETMDTVAAAESSADPRLLSGYPDVRDVAPTTARAVFSTNKRGTIYWALSALADGSISEEDVIAPPTYASTILRSGNLQAAASKTEYTANLAGMTSDGSYYLTAVMVDSRGQHSPVKVTAFSTPDDTVPAFANGYPVMTKITNNSGQVTVMTNKSCLVYYALLPQNSTAPRAQDFKSGSVTGNLGFGSWDAVKNSTLPFKVNSVDLEEQVTYDLYLWLTDYDGAHSSAVRKLTFTTVDGTPPIIRHMDQTDASANSVTMTYSVNEPATVYWAAVKKGEQFYRPLTGQSTTPQPTDDAAKLQVESGMGAEKKGNSAAARADTDVNFVISGLEGEAAYDVYYVAKDAAGNYSDSVRMVTVSTLDDNPPSVKQEFTRFNNGEDVNTLTPLANTNIRLVFSESVQGVDDTQQGTDPVYDNFEAAYAQVQNAANGTERDEARENLAVLLRKHIELWNRPALGQPIPVTDRGVAPNDPDWVIDYRYATIRMEEGRMVITFPTNEDNQDLSALKLKSGATYYFLLKGIADTAKPTLMGDTQLPDFTTVSAQVLLTVGSTYTISENDLSNLTGEKNSDSNGNIRIDMSFIMDPQTTDKADPTVVWDALLWSDTSMTYTLYSKPEGDFYWHNEGEVSVNVRGAESDGFAYRSLNRHFRGSTNTFPYLREMDLRTEYAIHVSTVDGRDEGANKETPWSQLVQMKVNVVSGNNSDISNLAGGNGYQSDWVKYTTSPRSGQSIGVPDPFVLEKQFSDEVAPKFVNTWPTIAAGDTRAQITVMLDRPGTVYYEIVALNSLEFDSTYANMDEYLAAIRNASSTTPQQALAEANKHITGFSTNVLPNVHDSSKFTLGDLLPNGTEIQMPLPKIVPTGGLSTNYNDTMNGTSGLLELSAPSVTTVTSASNTGTIWAGSSRKLTANAADTITVTDLRPDTLYYVYLATQGEGPVYSERATCFCFVTSAAIRPIITMQVNDGDVNVTVDRDADLDYVLVLTGEEGGRTTNTDFYAPMSDYADPEVMGLKESDFNYETGDTESQKEAKRKTAIQNKITSLYGVDGTITVLDAMSTDVMANRRSTGTVFDLCASEQAKYYFGRMIRGMSVSGSVIVMKGAGTFYVEDAPQLVECTGKERDNYYTLLAVGKSTLDSGDAFRSIRPVYNRDSEPPFVDNLEILASADANGVIASGSVIITFDDLLYFRAQGSTNQNTVPVDDCSKSNNGHDSVALEKADSVSIGSMITTLEGASGIWVATPGTVGHKNPIQTITLSLVNVNVASGAGISFNMNLCDRNGNKHTKQLTIVVRGKQRLDLTDPKKTVWDIECTVTPEWDHRDVRN